MAVEEPSVIAAASNAARMVREGGGFLAEADESLMTLRSSCARWPTCSARRPAHQSLPAKSWRWPTLPCPAFVERGGGCRDLEVRPCPTAAWLCTCTSTAATPWAPTWSTRWPKPSPTAWPSIASARVGLRILSNLCDRRLVRVSCRVPFSALRTKAGDADRRGNPSTRDRSRLALRRGRYLPRGHAQQRHHERRGSGRHRHRQRLARRRSRRPRVRRPRWTLPPACHLARGQRRPRRSPGHAHGARHRRRHLQVHAGARLALRILGNHRRASWPKSSAAWAWPKTSPHSKRSPAKAFSAATWPCIGAPPSRSKVHRSAAPRADGFAATPPPKFQ
jgi:hypothetical protein